MAQMGSMRLAMRILFTTLAQLARLEIAQTASVMLLASQMLPLIMDQSVQPELMRMESLPLAIQIPSPTMAQSPRADALLTESLPMAMQIPSTTQEPSQHQALTPMASISWEIPTLLLTQAALSAYAAMRSFSTELETHSISSIIFWAAR